MRGLFCGTVAKTNEEYKKVVKRRMLIMVLIGIAGAAALVVGLMAKNYWAVTIDERMLGFYTGIGTGLFAGAVILLIKDAILLRSEEKLKISRLNNADERNQEISNKAIKFAMAAILFAMYAVALVGGLYYPVLVKIILCMIFLFLLAYMGAYQFYNRRM